MQGSNMRYRVDTEHPVGEAARRLRDAIQAGGFTVVNEFDLQQALIGACQEAPCEAHLFDVCNAAQAVGMMHRDMDLVIGVTCRLAVYDHVGQTRMAMLRPTHVLGAMTASPARMDIAEELEQKIARIMDHAR